MGRLLNSSHSAMAYVSLLACHTFVDEALTDIDVLTFLRAYMNEVVTTLVPVAGVNFIEYRAKLVERFSNPYIKDTLARLALDGSQKFEATLGRALVEHFKGCAACNFDVLALAFAAFLRCCATSTFDGIAPSPDITIDDSKKRHRETRWTSKRKTTGAPRANKLRLHSYPASSARASRTLVNYPHWSTSTSRHWCSGV